MAQYFFDSSALAKLYHPEVGTAEVTGILSEPNRRIVISLLTLVEIQSVFAIKVRTGVITRQDADQFRGRMFLHVSARDFDIYTVTDSHFDAAEDLVVRYGFDHRLRTLDALHLAVAVDLRSKGLVDYFVTADKSMCEVAALEQFAVLNPEDP